jgi:hypothetical protein
MAPSSTGWHYNMLATPKVTVEIGAEHDRGHPRMVARNAEFGAYEHITTRRVPAAVLERIG